MFLFFFFIFVFVLCTLFLLRDQQDLDQRATHHPWHEKGEKHRNLWTKTGGWVPGVSSNYWRMFPQIWWDRSLDIPLFFLSQWRWRMWRARSLDLPLFILSPSGGEECFHEYGGLGPWIFLYLSIPCGDEECFHKNVMIGPWLFLYLSSPYGGEECFHEYGWLGP